MKKFNKARKAGLEKKLQSHWEGAAKILKLLARANHSLEVEPVVSGHYATDLLVNKYGL